jgi:hypothetical protein
MGQLFTAATHHLRPAVMMSKYLKKVIPRMHYKQLNYLKIADPIGLSLYMMYNEKVQHPSCPPSTSLSATQLSTLKSAGLDDPKYYNLVNIRAISFGCYGKSLFLLPSYCMSKF